MAMQPTQPQRQPSPPQPQRQPPDNGDRTRPAASTDEERRKMLREERVKRDRADDDILYRQATQGVPDDETRDKILALGGDATRSSPVLAQNLGDPPLGLTTTTGAYRSPIDPTTAAVPADPEDPEVMRRPRGFPTIGSGRKGGAREKLWQRPEKPSNRPLPTEDPPALEQERE